MKALSATQLAARGYPGYSPDKRKHRRQHRKAAARLQQFGGSIYREVSAWHLRQARYVGR